MEELELVMPTLEYKEDALKFLEEIKNVDAGLDWQYAGMSRLELYEKDYETWIKIKNDEKNGVHLPLNYVPSTTCFCVRKSDNKIIGMINIRHQLNDFLLKKGGHIGYSIRPSERKKGYGTKQLMKTLDMANKLGIAKVLVTCNARNIASAKTIEKCFGKLENNYVEEEPHKVFKRYWIDIKDFLDFINHL